MRREQVRLLQRVKEGDLRDASYKELLVAGGSIAVAEHEDDEVGRAELGLNQALVKVKFTRKVSEVEEDVNAAEFRGRLWNVVRQTRDHFYVTFTLERA